MANSWKRLKEEIEAETERIRLQEPNEVKKLRLGLIESGAGSYGQYFTTYDFAHHEVRALGCTNLYGILKAADEPGFTIEKHLHFTKNTLLGILKDKYSHWLLQ